MLMLGKISKNQSSPFCEKRLVFFSLIPGGNIGKQIIDKAQEAADKMTRGEKIEKFSKNDVFILMETEGNLNELVRSIEAAQAKEGIRNDVTKLKEAVAKDRFVENLIDKKERGDDINQYVSQEIDNLSSQERVKLEQQVENYMGDFQHLVRQMSRGDTPEEEIEATAAAFIQKSPHLRELAEKTGIPLAGLASAAGGATTAGLKKGAGWMETAAGIAGGLVSFRVAGRACEKMQVPRFLLTSFFSVPLTTFTSTVEECEGKKHSLNELKKMRDSESDRKKRIIISAYLSKNRNKRNTLYAMYQEFSSKVNLDKVRRELVKAAVKAKIPNPESAAEEKMATLTVSRYCRTLYATREDCDLLTQTFTTHLVASGGRLFGGARQLAKINEIFTEMHAFHRIPELTTEVADAQAKLAKAQQGTKAARVAAKGLKKAQKTLRIAQELQEEGAKHIREITKRMGDAKGWKYFKGSKYLAKIKASQHAFDEIARRKFSTTIGEETAKGLKGVSKGVKRGGGKLLKYGGHFLPAAILSGGFEAYNLATGRSSGIGTSLGRVGSTLLRVFPFIGTGIDWKEAMTGEEFLTGRKLNSKERFAAVGWGVASLAADVATIFTFGLGGAAKAAVSAGRLAKVTKVARTGMMFGGMGLAGGMTLHNYLDRGGNAADIVKKPYAAAKGTMFFTGHLAGNVFRERTGADTIFLEDRIKEVGKNMFESVEKVAGEAKKGIKKYVKKFLEIKKLLVEKFPHLNLKNITDQQKERLVKAVDQMKQKKGTRFFGIWLDEINERAQREPIIKKQLESSDGIIELIRKNTEK